MSKLVCKNCRSVDVEYEDYIGGTSYYICMTCGARGSEEKFTRQTIFDQITQSPETLAKKLVFWMSWHKADGTVEWFAVSTLVEGVVWDTKAEAIAATVAKLKEVCND